MARISRLLGTKSLALPQKQQQAVTTTPRILGGSSMTAAPMAASSINSATAPKFTSAPTTATPDASAQYAAQVRQRVAERQAPAASLTTTSADTTRAKMQAIVGTPNSENVYAQKKAAARTLGGVSNATPSVNGFSDEQVQNARTIYQVGKSRGMSDRDILIGLMTAMQESGLRNINYGDRDSVGLFQQRTSQGWGTIQQIMDPVYSAGKFFDGLSKVSDRDKIALTAAAQAVQRSAFPNAYAKHESQAAGLLAALTQPTASSAPTYGGVGPARQKLLDTAFSMLGINYSLGGGGYGVRQSQGKQGLGVDCSGLTSYVYGTLGIKLPRYSTSQYGAGYKTSIANAQPGDLVGWPKGGHVGIYIGNGQILHAPRPGQKVQIRNIFNGENIFAIHVQLPGE